MRDDFLFDDADSKQRGIGCDRKGGKKDGLALRWTWEKYGKKGEPSQTCYASLGEGWLLVAIFWHTNYEAGVEYYGNHIINYSKDIHDDSYKGEVIVTRVEAQLKAEQLVLDVWKELGDLLNGKGIITAKIIARLKGKKKIA